MRHIRPAFGRLALSILPGDRPWGQVEVEYPNRNPKTRFEKFRDERTPELSKYGVEARGWVSLGVTPTESTQNNGTKRASATARWGRQTGRVESLWELSRS